MAKKADNKKTLIAIGVAIIVAIIIAIIAILVINRGPNQIGGGNYFVSDDTKLVIPIDEGDRVTSDEEEPEPEKTYLVYFYNGDDITKFQTYQEYTNEETAQKALNYFQDTIAILFEEVSRDGRYVTLTHEPSDYQWVTTNDVKQQIEYTKEQ